MSKRIWSAAGHSAAGLMLLGPAAFAAWQTVGGSSPDAPPNATQASDARIECEVDLELPGVMSDILSNALTRGLKLSEDDVRAFLAEASPAHQNGTALLTAAAARFRIAEDALFAKVQKYKHANCSHAVTSTLPPGLRGDPQPHPACDVNLEAVGGMSDVLSNALIRGLSAPEREVAALLAGADDKYEDGHEVFRAAASHFKLSEDALAAEVMKFKHVNCMHPGGGRAYAAPLDDGRPVSAFARDVTLHVVLHEIGHALIREFDLPVLGNEETAADAFATYFVATHMPDRAVDVLVARTRSLMIEANETPEVDWRGEHDDDARRAYQIAALAIAADPQKYQPVAQVVGMTEQEIKEAADYGGEIRRAWRRVLSPLWMPEGVTSAEAQVKVDRESPFLVRVCEAASPQGRGLASEIEAAIVRFDWHSQVTVQFVEGDGGAAWNRSRRTVTVHSAYVRRFIAQGDQVLFASE